MGGVRRKDIAPAFCLSFRETTHCFIGYCGRMILHRTQRMYGREPHEHHRPATPLELLFDLTFVVAFSIAGNEFAHLVAEGHFGSDNRRIRLGHV